MAANNKIAAGDFVMVAGVKVHGSLFAKLVLFAAPATGMVSPPASPTGSVSATSSFSGNNS
jgi:hypothetical protein